MQALTGMMVILARRQVHEISKTEKNEHAGLECFDLFSAWRVMYSTRQYGDRQDQSF